MQKNQRQFRSSLENPSRMHYVEAFIEGYAAILLCFMPSTLLIQRRLFSH